MIRSSCIQTTPKCRSSRSLSISWSDRDEHVSRSETLTPRDLATTKVVSPCCKSTSRELDVRVPTLRVWAQCPLRSAGLLLSGVGRNVRLLTGFPGPRSEPGKEDDVAL